MSDRYIRVSHMEPSSDLLGPGNRFIVWVHGCCFDCPGCLALNTRFGPYKDVAVSDLAAQIADSGADGITLSGGEPFLQAEALAELVQAVRAVVDIGVIVYSGFTLEELAERADSGELLSRTDLLIDGRYVQELNDGRAYIGSSNQKMHFLTDRYIDAAGDYYSSPQRRAEIKFTPEQLVLVGVPTADTLKIWNEIKKKFGRGVKQRDEQ